MDCSRHVHHWPKADVNPLAEHVCFRKQSGHQPESHRDSSDRDQQVPELVLADLVAGLDDGRAVELLEDGGPLERRIERQAVAGVDRHLVPAVGEPHAALAALGRLQGRCALAGGAPAGQRS